jgi:hypothetical protein
MSDTANEDWLKGLSWDLPTQFPGLLFALTGTSTPAVADGKAALRNLMSLPAWDAAPSNIKRLAKAYMLTKG